MANITNFTFQGAANVGTGAEAAFSFTPPSGAWTYQLTITDGVSYNKVKIVNYTDQNTFLNNQGYINFNIISGALVPGTTYTASIKYSTVTPPGAPVFSSTAVTTTFSIATNTAGLVNPGTADTPEQITLNVFCWPLTAVSGGSITLTGPSGYNQTQVVNMSGQTFPYFFSGVVGGSLYTAVLTLPGLTSITRTFYAPLEPNKFGTPVVGTTSITLPWTLPTGASVSASNAFSTCMLYNQDKETWISTQVVATSGSQTVTISGLDVNTSYELYCWPTNAGGFASIGGPGGDHSITFVTGGTATGANFGINGWFYSPVSN